MMDRVRIPTYISTLVVTFSELMATGMATVDALQEAWLVAQATLSKTSQLIVEYGPFACLAIVLWAMFYGKSDQVEPAANPGLPPPNKPPPPQPPSRNVPQQYQQWGYSQTNAAPPPTSNNHPPSYYYQQRQ